MCTPGMTYLALVLALASLKFRDPWLKTIEIVRKGRRRDLLQEFHLPQGHIA